MSTNTIPASYQQDRYWRGMLHLFMNHSKLKSVFTTKYFDLDEGTVKIKALKRNAGPWSRSEKFMLNLALHLFNSRNKVDLGEMDCLDDYNRKLAFEALRLRYY